MGACRHSPQRHCPLQSLGSRFQHSANRTSLLSWEVKLDICVYYSRLLGRPRLDIRKRFFTRHWCWALGWAPPGNGQGTKPDKAQVGQCSQTYGLIFRWSCVESLFGLDSPWWSLPISDILILWVYKHLANQTDLEHKHTLFNVYDFFSPHFLWHAINFLSSSALFL